VNVRRYKPQVNAYCTYCKEVGAEKVKAFWYLTHDHSKRACESHKANLAVQLEADQQREQQDPSEADYQTWHKL
jgi:hypothetical protein